MADIVLDIKFGAEGSLSDEFAAYQAKLEAAIADAMENEVFALGRDAIIASLFSGAYRQYTPQGRDPYVRRYDEGGLADPDNIVRAEGGPTGEPLSYEIEIEDIAPDEDGLPVAEIVESGEGYHWKNSRIYALQPFPRPIYDPAEQLIEENNWFSSTIMRALRTRGLADGNDG